MAVIFRSRPIVSTGQTSSDGERVPEPVDGADYVFNSASGRKSLPSISATWVYSVLESPADVRDFRQRIKAALSACECSGCCRLIIGGNMGESDIARQIRENVERRERQLEEADRRRNEADKRTDRFIRWFAWPMCALMFLLLIYTVTPTIINAVIKATHEWQALLR